MRVVFYSFVLELCLSLDGGISTVYGFSNLSAISFGHFDCCVSCTIHNVRHFLCKSVHFTSRYIHYSPANVAKVLCSRGSSLLPVIRTCKDFRCYYFFVLLLDFLSTFISMK